MRWPRSDRVILLVLGVLALAGALTIGGRMWLRGQEVRELFRVRAALEKLAVTEIMSSPGRDAAAETLREAFAKLAGAELDFVERVEADLGFHLLLCRLAGNSMLVEAWRQLEGRIRVAIMSSGPDRAPRPGPAGGNGCWERVESPGEPQAGELVEPAGGRMRITRSSCGVGLPAPSLFDVVSQSAPSGAPTTVRSRP